jgi:quinol monooxygenase YgiN
MTVIVAGKLQLKPGKRDEFIQKSLEAVVQARQLDACVDFSVSADPIDDNRVNVLEKWTSRSHLEEFRHSGPDNDSFTLVESFDVTEHEINTSHGGAVTPQKPKDSSQT